MRYLQTAPREKLVRSRQLAYIIKYVAVANIQNLNIVQDDRTVITTI